MANFLKATMVSFYSRWEETHHKDKALTLYPVPPPVICSAVSTPLELPLPLAAPSPMQSAQAMAADKIGAVAEGMREVSISSAPPAAATAPATASGGGGAEESKDQSEGMGDGGDAEEMDENDPLWKVSRCPSLFGNIPWYDGTIHCGIRACI